MVGFVFVGPALVGFLYYLEITMKGKVANYQELAGFGWLLVGFKEFHYFHIANWKGDAAPIIGQAVAFQVAPGRKPWKTQAVNVTPITAETVVSEVV
jgi:cold shock CspA family protein